MAYLRYGIHISCFYQLCVVLCYLEFSVKIGVPGFLVQRSHRNYRPRTGRKSNEAKQMRFLYFTYNVVLLHRKWKKSIFHWKSTGRFLHGMPLKCHVLSWFAQRAHNGITSIVQFLFSLYLFLEQPNILVWSHHQASSNDEEKRDCVA